MRRKRLVAGGMLAAMIVSTVCGNGNLAKVSARNSDTEAPKGLWITEIYNNDVDRSTKADKRLSGGYNTVNTFKSATDLMEFIEITNTSDKEIDFNKDYKLYYEADGKAAQQSVTWLDGSTDVKIKPGESVVFWNYRTDVAGPTEKQFRNDLRIPAQTRIAAVNSGNVNWKADGATFRLETATGDVCSQYTATSKDTADGFSVELAIPDMGDKMNLYMPFALPSPGTAYSGQLNGQVKVKVPEDVNPKGLYVTEIFPNDTNRGAVYGTTKDDLMECFEITNTTDEDIDLNNDYEIDYVVKESFFKKLVLYTSDLSSQDCILPAHQTAVIWCNRTNYQDAMVANGLTKFPTDDEFRKAFNIPEETKVFAFTNQSGMNNTNRGIAIFKKNADGSKELISNYNYNGVTDLKDNRSVDLSVNPEGPEMSVYKACNTQNMGHVADAQITYGLDE